MVWRPRHLQEQSPFLLAPKTAKPTKCGRIAPLKLHTLDHHPTDPAVSMCLKLATQPVALNDKRTSPVSRIIYWAQVAILSFLLPLCAGPANQIVLNGIEYVNGALLAGARPRPGLAELYRVPLNNPQGMAKVEITNGNLTSLDGLMFDDEKDFLYVVSRPTFFAGTIVVLASTDGWRTAQVMTKTDVPRTCRTPTTAAFVASGDNRGLWVICSNGFGPQGPYAIQKVDAPIAKIVRTTPMEIIFPALLNPLGARRAWTEILFTENNCVLTFLTDRQCLGKFLIKMAKTTAWRMLHSSSTLRILQNL